MVIYKYTIAWAYKGDHETISFGPGPDGEDHKASVLSIGSLSHSVAWGSYDTFEKACEYLDSSKSFNNWKVADPYIIKEAI